MRNGMQRTLPSTGRLFTLSVDSYEVEEKPDDVFRADNPDVVSEKHWWILYGEPVLQRLR